MGDISKRGHGIERRKKDVILEEKIVQKNLVVQMQKKATHEKENEILKTRKEEQ